MEKVTNGGYNKWRYCSSLAARGGKASGLYCAAIRVRGDPVFANDTNSYMSLGETMPSSNYTGEVPNFGHA